MTTSTVDTTSQSLTQLIDLSGKLPLSPVPRWASVKESPAACMKPAPPS